MIRTTTSSAPPFTRWSSDGMQKVIGAQVIGAQTQNTQSNEELLVDSHSCQKLGTQRRSNGSPVSESSTKLSPIIVNSPIWSPEARVVVPMDDLVKAAEREVEMEAA